MSQSEKKHISYAYVPPPPPPVQKCADSAESRPPVAVASTSGSCCTGKEKNPPMPKWNCFDIPKPKPSKCQASAPVPKPFCSSAIMHPTIHCPPIQRPPICPIQITIQHDMPAGSCSNCDTIERESNTISLTADGKTTVLCSEGYERKAKYMTRKDTKGLTHSYCKEVETRSNMAKGDSGSGKSGKTFLSTKSNSGGARGLESRNSNSD